MGTLPRLQAHLSYLLLCITNIFFNLQLIEVLIYLSMVETIYFTGNESYMVWARKKKEKMLILVIALDHIFMANV